MPRILPLLAGVAVLSGCLQGTSKPADKPAGTVATTAPAVTIEGFKFAPTPLTVKKGQTVVFTNLDGDAHTVAPDEAGSKITETAQITRDEPGKPGKRAQITFSEAGTIKYKCGIHPSMKGQITVE